VIFGLPQSFWAHWREPGLWRRRARRPPEPPRLACECVPAVICARHRTVDDRRLATELYARAFRKDASAAQTMAALEQALAWARAEGATQVRRQTGLP
jgi:hypothetical protein